MERGPVRWLLTREAGDAAAEGALLSEAGLPWASVPCIECTPGPWPSWAPRPGTPVYFLTSRRVLSGLDGAPLDGLVAAVAPATSSALRERGYEVHLEASGGAVALARRLVEVWEGQGRPTWHLRYPTSDVGLGAREQQAALALLTTVGPVERVVAYRTGAPAGLEASLAAQLQGAYGLSFSSPSAVKSFFAARPAGAPAPRRVVCFGESTRRAWAAGRPAAWPDAEAAVTSAIHAILAVPEPA